MTPGRTLDPRDGRTRGLRAAVLTVPAVAVAALVHRTVDPCVDLLGTGLALGACWSGAVAVLGRPRGRVVLFGWLVVTQLVTHVLLVLTCPAGGSLLPGREPLLAHGGALLVLTVLLHRADSGLWAAHALHRAVRRLLLPSWEIQVPAAPAGLAPAAAPVLRPRLLLDPPARRRGPPCPATC